MIKTPLDFYRKLVEKFPFEPTNSQNILLEELSNFVFDTNKQSLFLIKGYAGTGKTTTISTVVNNLWEIGKKAVLLAPTGRAAKVISGYSKRQAFTIHKKIYFPKKNKGGGVDFTLQYSKQINDNLSISSRGTFTYAHNNVDINNEPAFSEFPNLSAIGYPIGTHLGYVAERLFIDQAEVDNNPVQQLGGFVSGGDIKYTDITGDGIINSEERITTVKTRVIGNNHQVIRVDSEIDTPLSLNDNDKIYTAINALIDNHKIDVVVFQDYDKGVITEKLIQDITNLCNNKSIPTAVDPKKRNFAHYKNATLFKPNLKELKEGLNIEINPANIEEVEAAIDELNQLQKNKINFITLSEHGVLIKDQSTKKHIPAHIRSIADVSGAGDTVISVASLCLALNQSITMTAEISNLAGGLVCESVGVVPVDKDQLLSEAIANLI